VNPNLIHFPSFQALFHDFISFYWTQPIDVLIIIACGMFNMKHRNQEEGQRFTFTLKPRRRRLSPGTLPGRILVERQTNTVDSLQFGMQQDLYNLNTFRFNRIFLRSSRNTAQNPYYDNMKPFLFVMRAMGMLPLSATTEGKLQYGVTIRTSLGKY